MEPIKDLWSRKAEDGCSSPAALYAVATVPALCIHATFMGFLRDTQGCTVSPPSNSAQEQMSPQPGDP